MLIVDAREGVVCVVAGHRLSSCGCRLACPGLDALPQPLHGCGSIYMAVLRDFAESGIGKLTEVRSHNVEKIRWDPVLLLFG